MLARAGHEVEVITANVDYKNARKRFPNHSGVYRLSIDGVNITYVPVFTSFRGSFPKRILFFATFVLSSLKQALSQRNVDLIIAVSTPLTVGLLGVIASKLRRKPLVFEVTDVWPEAAIQTGVLKNPVMIGLARILEKICYRSSTKIICLTEGIRSAILSKGTQPAKLAFIPNGVDFDLFGTVAPQRRALVRSEMSCEGKFVAMYLGAHGTYNSLETILEAASLLRHRNDIQFVLVGEGDEKQKLINFVTKNRLDNVKFIGTVSRNESVEILSAADVFLLPNRKGEFFEGNLPNKLFDFLASARPVIVAGRGESADLVTRARAGMVVQPGNADSLSNAIRVIQEADPSERDQMGTNGRQYVKTNFSREAHASRLIDIANEASRQ